MYIDENVKYYLLKAFDAFMILSPNFGYIAQIIKFHKVKSSEGFSKFISFVLLIANILRIFFWFGKKYSTALLIQSIVALFMQIYLLKECLKFSKHTETETKEHLSPAISGQKINYLKNYFKNFWNWPCLRHYLVFLMAFSLTIGTISQIIGYDNILYIEVLGAASASVEAIIAVPQIISNFRSKNTESISSIMVSTWVIGDSIKTYYYLVTEAPFQLLCSGIFQVSTDIFLFFQIFYYYFKRRLGIHPYSEEDELRGRLYKSVKEIEVSEADKTGKKINSPTSNLSTDRRSLSTRAGEATYIEE